MKFSYLLSPIEIGGIVIKNRIAMAPMGTHLQDENGFVTEPLIRYLERRAEGGVGLLLVQFSSVVPGQPTLGVYSDRHIEGLARLAAAIKRHDCAVFIQISHLGAADPNDPVAASSSSSPLYLNHTVLPRELSVKEIKTLEEAFVKAAYRAREAGFDGIEFHGGYSYLVASFYSPHLNRRQDSYGGDFFKRMRFIDEVLGGIKQKTPGFPIGFKLNAHEHVTDGIKLPEAGAIARYLEQKGVSYIHVVSSHSLDSYCEYPEVPSLYNEKAAVHLAGLAAEIKKNVKIPVLMTGGINTPDRAEEVLREGKADVIVVGRQLIADPEWPKKVAEGRPYRPCIRCNICHIREVLRGKEVRCTVNPLAGNETIFRSNRVPPKRVAIIGGGAAGMQAALAASQRGHSVVLFEQEDKLGGKLLLAGLPPFKKDVRDFTHFLTWQIQQAPIEVRLGVQVGYDDLVQEESDAIIFATGAKPIWPNIPGLGIDNAITAVDLLKDSLENFKSINRFAILGAGKVGLETAWYLSILGKKVVLIDVLEEKRILEDEHPFNRVTLLRRIQELGIPLLCERTCVEVRNRKLLLVNEAGDTETVDFDKIVLATGFVPETSLQSSFVELSPITKTISIGDCVEPRDLFAAVHEGFNAGWTLEGRGLNSSRRGVRRGSVNL